VQEFEQVYRRLLETHGGIVSLHLAGALSGTVDAARRAATEVDPQRIRVIDTRRVSVGIALLVEAAGRAIERGARLDEIEGEILAARDSTGIFGTVSSLDQAVKGGRLSERRASLLRAAHLYPIIVFSNEGRAERGGVAFGFDGALRQLVRRAVAFAQDGPARAMVVHTGLPEQARAVADGLADRLDLADVPIVNGGPVIATHVGLGCVTVGIARRQGALGGGAQNAM
jgi:DegV family protein with EDD domain